MKLAPMRIAHITTNRPSTDNAMIIGVRFPLTGPMLGVFLRSSPTAPDIESESGVVSPGWNEPPASSPAVTAGSGSGLSVV